MSKPKKFKSMAKSKKPTPPVTQPGISLSGLTQSGRTFTWNYNGLPGVPRVVQIRFCDEDTFLAEDGVEGRNVMTNNYNPDPSVWPTTFTVGTNWTGYEPGTQKFVQVNGDYLLEDGSRGFFKTNVVDAIL